MFENVKIVDETLYTENELEAHVDLPPDIQEDFDYVKDTMSPRFLKFKGMWLDIGDMMMIEDENWDAYHPMTYFSGVVIKQQYDNGEETYKVAYYHT